MFEYRVNWYNDYEDKEIHAQGLVAANGYLEAVEKILHDYGEQNIIDLYLQALEDTNVIELDTIKRQFKLD